LQTQPERNHADHDRDADDDARRRQDGAQFGLAQVT
jgi:hypothetical protein